ncbi:MAG: hypothetical protein LN561_05230 [Rickettsia endosymbiont of Labidopullus appendiculatus]|nr:hypothetical protein [Rickettsia endosymbiont of Labidopullus appendiculatus]
MTVFNDDLLEKVRYNSSEGNINLWKEKIGDREIEALGAALQNNKTVWTIQLPGKSGNITYKGLKSFAEKIALREDIVFVETNNCLWNETFRYIEGKKRAREEVDKLDDFLPTKSLALEEAKLVKEASVLEVAEKASVVEVVEETPMVKVVEEVSVVEVVKEAPVLEVAEKASVVEVVEAPVIEVVEETPMVEVVKEVGKAEEAESVGDYVNDSVNVVPESFNASYQENLATILPNDIKSVKIKPTGFFAKIYNAFTTMKYTLDSLFNHNTTNDYDSSKFYVTKDDMFEEDIDTLGRVDDMHNY